jgi:hypothetical protein
MMAVEEVEGSSGSSRIERAKVFFRQERSTLLSGSPIFYTPTVHTSIRHTLSNLTVHFVVTGATRFYFT